MRAGSVDFMGYACLQMQAAPSVYGSSGILMNITVISLSGCVVPASAYPDKVWAEKSELTPEGR